MKNALFSETQFFIGYCRELFIDISLPFPSIAPSTRKEKASVSEMIICHLSKTDRYRYSEFYKFKHSKYYNTAIFHGIYVRS